MTGSPATQVATVSGQPVGFASLKGADEIAFLYVFIDLVWLSTTMAKRPADATSLAFNRGRDKSGPLSAAD